LIEAVFLVDGMAAGTWSLETTKTDAVVRIRPFAGLSRADRGEASREAELLARFMAPAAKTHGARIG
jgi:hypothetical protein